MLFSFRSSWSWSWSCMYNPVIVDSSDPRRILMKLARANVIGEGERPVDGPARETVDALRSVVVVVVALLPDGDNDDDDDCA